MTLLLRWREAALWAGVGILLSSCTAVPSPDAPGAGETPSASESASGRSAAAEPGVVERGIRATVVQQRIDVGTRRIGVQVSTGPETAMRVVSVQLVSPAFDRVPPTPKDTTFMPGQTIDLLTTYGDAVCGGPKPADDLTARLEVRDALDDTSAAASPATVRITGSGVGLLRRRHRAECAEQLLARATTISYSRFRRGRAGGKAALVGALRLRRPPAGSTDPVAVTGLAGSVLFTLEPVDKGGRLIARLRSSDNARRVPVAIAPVGRCDQHARSQSQQTFLFSAFVRTASGPEHRVVLVPPKTLQRAANTLLDDLC